MGFYCRIQANDGDFFNWLKDIAESMCKQCTASQIETLWSKHLIKPTWNDAHAKPSVGALESQYKNELVLYLWDAKI